MKDRDAMLRSIEANAKKTRYTKRTRLHQEQRFHNAYLHKTPRGPEKTRAYLDGEPPKTTNLNDKTVKGIDEVAIDIMGENDHQPVEQPAELTGDKATKRLRRHLRINQHQRQTRKLKDKLDAYRADPDPLSPRKGELVRRRLITPDQYIARIQDKGIPRALSGVTELYAPRRASPDTINVGHASIKRALRGLPNPLDNLSGDYDITIIDNEHHQLSISEVGLGGPNTLRPYYRQQTIDHTYR